jgi:hypothetical protein
MREQVAADEADEVEEVAARQGGSVGLALDREGSTAAVGVVRGDGVGLVALAAPARKSTTPERQAFGGPVAGIDAEADTEAREDGTPSHCTTNK